MNNHEIYKNKKVFITGHTGFKGSWLALWLSEIGAEVAGYSLPAEELSHFNLLKLKVKNYFNNINDEKNLEAAMLEFKPDIVFHLAAQPLVRDSYNDPITTFNTNVTGSLKVYLAALKAKVPVMVSITTDKVYENKEWHWSYRENDLLGGHDPYSASKACMEIMTESFRKSFLQNDQMLLATTRAGNVIGGGDWAKDRLIPDLVRNASQQITTPMRNPLAIRPWQHVLEPLHAYLILGEKLLQGQKKYTGSYNIGPNSSDNLTVEEISKLAKSSWNEISYKFENSLDQKHEAGLLKLDISKAMIELNWAPRWTAEEAIIQTINWYKNYYNNKTVSSLEDLRNFTSRQIL